LPTRYDDVVELTGNAIDLLTDLRPQRYGFGSTDEVINPIVEPQWAGIRVLAGIDDGVVALRDEEGKPFTERPSIDVRAFCSSSRIRRRRYSPWS